MKKVITYGTYDLLHYGHLALLERARALGDYLIVGVTSDAYDKSRGKLNVQQSLAERIEAVRKTGLADEIIAEEYEGQKIDDIRKYGVDIFTVGSDWVGKFDYLNEYCEVVYLSRTEGISSTAIRTEQNKVIRLGIIGLENPTDRFPAESSYVSGLSVTALYAEDTEKASAFCKEHDLTCYDALAPMLEQVDAVYISEPVDRHYELIMQALSAGRHVLCESPLFLSRREAQKAFALAKEKNLVLFEAIKTLFFPAFEHLRVITGSGLIGEIRDIDVSCSVIPEDYEKIRRNPFKGSFYDWGSIALAPILKLLGTGYTQASFYPFTDQGFHCLTRGLLCYPQATASFKIGKGIKTEGQLIITGTKGYLYVPAPWWLPDYFEIRYEDLRSTKKYFYQYNGAGLRYEILEFVRMINQGAPENYKHPISDMLAATDLMEQFHRQFGSGDSVI